MNQKNSKHFYLAELTCSPDSIDLLNASHELGGDKADIDFGKIKLFIGNRPIARNLRTLSNLKGEKLPAEYEYFSRYDIWMVTYNIQIQKSGGFKNVKQIGLQVKYPSGILDPRIVILNSIPDTSLIRLAEGSIDLKAGIDLSGALEVKPVHETVKEILDLGFGGKVYAKAAGSFGINLQMDILSSNIVAIGTGNTMGQWVINRDGSKPLLGNQLLVHTILTPPNLNNLQVELKANATIAGVFGFFPVRFEAEEIPLKIQLEDSDDSWIVAY